MAHCKVMYTLSYQEGAVMTHLIRNLLIAALVCIFGPAAGRSQSAHPATQQGFFGQWTL